MNVKRCVCGLVALAVCLVLTSVASAEFTAYNDCVWRSDHAANASNVTLITIGNGNPGPTSGLLVNQADGAATGVTATLTQNGGVNWQPDLTTGGSDCNAGTDASTIFGGTPGGTTPPRIAGMQGVIYYGSSGWWVDLTLSGLNPAKTYEFVTSSNRNGGSGYDGRLTKYTLSGADAFTNTSSTGTTIAGASTTFSTGNNTANGYVARWADINPGSDGTVTIRAESAAGNSYSFDVFRLTEVPEPSTIALLIAGGLGLAVMAFRRRK